MKSNLKTGLIGAVVAVFASTAQADFVINDDLIVDGSACVGFDCVNGESFGFDTIRLKENNLRIGFTDTSVAASYPRRDWEITINDSANGGAEYFGVKDVTSGRMPFRVTGGARANALFVASNGDVGLGTTTPVLELHARGGDTPGYRMEQDGSSGWQPQTWDIAGNETNFFVRDVSNGSTLPFRIRPGAPSSALEIAVGGNIGMGTASPNTILDIVGADATLRLGNSDADNVEKIAHFATGHFDTAEQDVAGMVIESRETTNLLFLGGGSSDFNAVRNIRFYTAADAVTTQGTERMRILSSGKVAIARTAVAGNNWLQVGDDATNGNGASLTIAGVWTNGSSRTNKINILDLPLAAARAAVDVLNPVTYRGLQDPAEEYVGFIAEDIPDLVAMNDRKGIAAIEVVAVLTAVVKDHKATIETQTAMIEALTARLDALEAAAE